jgi:hypothetical protein
MLLFSSFFTKMISDALSAISRFGYHPGLRQRWMASEQQKCGDSFSFLFKGNG